jgi:hypothetical protein
MENGLRNSAKQRWKWCVSSWFQIAAIQRRLPGSFSLTYVLQIGMLASCLVGSRSSSGRHGIGFGLSTVARQISASEKARRIRAAFFGHLVLGDHEITA